MSYNYQNNGYTFNRASTPNPALRQNFQAPPNVQVRKQAPGIKIVKNKGSSQVVIETSGDKRNADHSYGPQIERPNTPNPVISYPRNYDRAQTPSQPQSTSISSMNSGSMPMNVSSLGPGAQISINQSAGNISIVKGPSSPQISISSQQAPQQLQRTNPPSKAQTTSQPNQVPFPNPQPDAFHRLSLLSFVSTFEDEKSFNETDLEVLGLDLKCQEPLLPMLHSVLSDAPLLDHSRHPMPECYSKIQSGKPIEKISLFSPQTLLFIFYTYPRDPLQVQAAAELIRRNWMFDEVEGWRDQDGNTWSVDQWRESEEIQGNELGDSMFLHRTE
ncbi:transcriptional regulator [Tritrichomonas musculus]|uniref:Transcriptional regulator n=1 Tax=Tritrichomonas musculus TaxID=1915356 RepID=A0ABR2GIV5_9EUKA